jgi:transposase
MLFVRSLEATERQQLQRGARREVGRVAERMRALLLSSRGYSVPQVAEIFECDAATVRTWIQRFEDKGVQGLRDLPRSGRPPRADAAVREGLRRDLEAGAPAAEGEVRGPWSVPKLRAHLLLALHVVLSRCAVRRLLHRLGYVWRRPRHELPRDPNTAAMMRSLAERLLRAPASAVVLCLDECDIHLLPALRAMWMRKGEQKRIPTPGQNRKRSLFGALELESGRWHYLVQPRKRTVEFILFLEQLLVAYPSEPLILVLDNASIHGSRALLAWLAEHPRIELLYLPAYSGHRENPVEKVWWRLKDEVASDRLHASIDALETATHRFFASFTPEAALRLAA